MRTSLNHQPEAQHPKSSAIHKPQADYPIYYLERRHLLALQYLTKRATNGHSVRVLTNVRA